MNKNFCILHKSKFFSLFLFSFVALFEYRVIFYDHFEWKTFGAYNIQPETNGVLIIYLIFWTQTKDFSKYIALKSSCCSAVVVNIYMTWEHENLFLSLRIMCENHFFGFNITISNCVYCICSVHAKRRTSHSFDSINKLEWECVSRIVVKCAFHSN